MHPDALAGQRPFFVYGTLLPGQANASLWQGTAVWQQPAVLANGRLYSLGHYPMLVEEPGEDVKGVVIAIEPAAYARVLRRLDDLEGYIPHQPQNSYYQRVCRQVTLADGRTLLAWVYVGHRALVHNRPIVPGGDWAAYVRQAQNTKHDP